MKRSRLRPMSAKRRREAAERRAVVAIVLERANGRCEIQGPHCWGLATTAHEVWKRSRFPGSHLDPSVCVASCAPCNSYVEDEPAWAEANGWSVPSETPRPGAS